MKSIYENNGSLAKLYSCEGSSLYFLSSENKLRNFVAKVTRSQAFEMFILLLICISSVLLALDNPLNNPESTLVYFLYIADIILTAFFAIEAIFKILTYGFLINGNNSYMRNGWNFIDFIVVVFSIASLSVSSINLKFVKILRLLRVLRPLRVISRNKGLKVGL